MTVARVEPSPVVDEEHSTIDRVPPEFAPRRRVADGDPPGRGREDGNPGDFVAYDRQRDEIHASMPARNRAAYPLPLAEARALDKGAERWGEVES
jgi:hypothetical protein